MSMQTFKDLYEYLQTYDEDNIIDWLKDRWEGKDKQESLLRLFAGLGLIDKLTSYTICKGNFNMKTITKHLSTKCVFYDGNTLINLKDKGDASDLTGIYKENEKHLLVTTSKNLNKTQVGKLDIDKILTNFKQYEGYTMSLCICIRDCDDFRDMKNGIEKTNKELKFILEKDDTIIIDWNDLNQAYHQFKMNFGDKSLDKIINSSKSTLCLKMHQHLGVLKTIKLKSSGVDKILWGHIQRSGKSYIIGGTIIEDSKNKNECNYLIITTAPNETIEQQRKVFNCNQLNDFNVIVLKSKKKPALSKKNIILCSKQFLQSKISDDKEKTTNIAWLKKIQFDVRFIDESHNGGTTELAKKTLAYYGKKSFTVQITATYTKPVNDFNIPKENWILWDLEDIKLCKNIRDEKAIDRLVEKHGDIIRKIIKNYSLDNLIREYSKYPELWLLTHEIKKDVVSDIISATKDNNYGWSPEACFLLKRAIKKDKTTGRNSLITKTEFQNEEEALKLWYTIFGKKCQFGIPDKEFPDKIVFMKRIQSICQRLGTRFIGQGDFHNEPMIIMTFLPVYTDRGKGYLSKLSKATIKLLKKYNVIPDYDIITLNDDGKGKKDIEDARNKARISGKKGVLVLSGTKCGLGVSINNCDIVLLLNNNNGFDMIYQMMFRSMTEGKNKKCGFVVDLDVRRAIKTSVDYATIVKPGSHPEQGTSFILQERLINLNGDHWMPSFGNKDSMIKSLCENIYEIYSSDVLGSLGNLINRLANKEILLTTEEQELFNTWFHGTSSTKIQKNMIDNLLEDDEQIQKGIEKQEVNYDEKSDTISESTISTDSSSEQTEQKQVNYMVLFKAIAPLMCFLSSGDEGTSFIEMVHYIENNEYIYNILIAQTKSWWGKSVDSKILKIFFNIYIKYMKNDKEANQIIRTMKELIMKNINNRNEMSQLVDKYLIPQELEVKNNAEISTKYPLRQDMLNTLPLVFWTLPKKVFEPCAGKGGFLIDIVDKFMNGLKDYIPDEDERYRKIVEECLYFSDINSTNIFICKLLLDPTNKYKLNYNEGNTLELDISETTEHWNRCTGFDAIIGNPPYQLQVGPRKSHPIWNLFTKGCMDMLNIDGYLLFVHPSGWRSPEGVFRDVYDKIASKNLLYINMNDFKKGQEVFGVGTNFDYYLVQNNNNKQKVHIVDIKDKTYNIDLSNWTFIPSGEFESYEKILAMNGEDKVNILHDYSSYETRKPWMSKKESEEYKHPVCYTITEKKGLNLHYSSKINGHFDIPKVIWSNGLGTYPIIDEDGKYALTQFSYGIIDDKQNLNNIALAMKKKEFINLMGYVKFQNNKYSYKVIGLLKKDFWKEFI